jgi:hypothetical protein
MTAPIKFQDPIETMFKQIEDGVFYANAGMQPYMEAQYVNITFLLILNTRAIPDASDTGNSLHQSTKCGMTSADNLHEPSGTNALSQGQPAAIKENGTSTQKVFQGRCWSRKIQESRRCLGLMKLYIQPLYAHCK